MSEMSIQQKLREKRIRLQIVLSQVEDALHVSASSISHWERGKRNMPCFPEFPSLYQQYLDDCEAGKIQYVKSQRAGNDFHFATNTCYSSHETQENMPPQIQMHFQDYDKKSSLPLSHPDYYKSDSIEAIDYIDAHHLGFNLGNVIKYVTRAGRKDSEDVLTALRKAQWYLEREIARYSKEKSQHEQ